MTTARASLGALAAALAPAPAQEVAERAVHPESGHTYLRTSEPLSFYDAEALARSVGGTLAAVDSAEKETWLLENFGASEAYWIGLEFPREQWHTGTQVTFTHWAPGEPGGGAAEPLTLWNWGEPGSWGDTSGDVASDRYRALIELPPGVSPGPIPALPPARPSNRGVLLCAIHGLAPEDLENPRLAHLNGFWKDSAWTFDAGADGSGDPLAGLGMVLWGVGSAKSRLSSAAPGSAAIRTNENLLARLEHVRSEVTTAALLDDPALGGILLEGRIDVRASNASPRRGGSTEPLKDALARATPLCLVAAWTDLEARTVEAGSGAARAKELAAIDEELGTLLANLRARPSFAAEEWWIAVTGLAPPARKKEKADDPRARTAVPLCLAAGSVPVGEMLGEVALVDLVPSALAHLGVEARRSWGLDGRALALDRAPAYGANLVVNGGAEAQLGWGQDELALITGWRQLGGFRIGRHLADDLGPPERGQSYFVGGTGSAARLEQTIDLVGLAADIGRGGVRFRFSGWLGMRKRSAAALECALEFLGANKKPLERHTLGPLGPGERKGFAPPGILALEAAGRVPRRARAARLILAAMGADGLDQTMADELSLVLERD